MSVLLFVDESGYDCRESPYQVLAGLTIQDRDLWNLICQVQEAEVSFFGRRITPGTLELKGKELLKRKTFRLAQQLEPFEAAERTELARICIEKGIASQGQPTNTVTRRELTALGQAKIAFVKHLLELCGQFRVKAIASITDRDALRPAGDFLRKDYSYLFERYFYYLDPRPGDQLGLVVFDELDRSLCHILVDQMRRYFSETATGRMRSGRIIPEPFFVHSDLTTLIQFADIVAYIIAWGVKVGDMGRERRDELSALAQRVCQLRHRATLDDDFVVWSFAVIDDLRPREERNGQ